MNLDDPRLEEFSRKLGEKWHRFRPRPRVRRGPLPVSFVITSMPVGGAEVLLASLMRGLDPKRFAPEIICLKERGPLGTELAKDFPVHEKFISAKWDLRVLPKLTKHLRERETAAVITVGAGDKMFWGRLAAWLAGVPVIGSALHSTGWPDGIGKLNRKLNRITDAFIAVADQHADFLRQQEGLPPERVFTIRNGVNTKRFRPLDHAFEEVRQELGLSLSAPVFAIVAALRPEKNHEMFLRVARRVVDQCPSARFLIIGDGPQRKHIETRRSQLGLEQEVILLGSRSDTPRLLNATDVFLLCIQNEASPVSILEALACQVPVVSTSVGSVGESVRDGETGFLVPVDDDAAMTQRVFELLSNPEVHAAMGQRGRELVENLGSLEVMVHGYAKLIERLYDQRSKLRNRPEDLVDRRRVAREIEGEHVESNGIDDAALATSDAPMAPQEAQPAAR